MERIPAPSRTRKHILITDSVLDRLGHDDELEMLGSGLALDRYYDMIINLRTAGWRRIAIVTDHLGSFTGLGTVSPERRPYPVLSIGRGVRMAFLLLLNCASPIAMPQEVAGRLWLHVVLHAGACMVDLAIFIKLHPFRNGLSRVWQSPGRGQAQPVDVRITPNSANSFCTATYLVADGSRDSIY